MYGYLPGIQYEDPGWQDREKAQCSKETQDRELDQRVEQVEERTQLLNSSLEVTVGKCHMLAAIIGVASYCMM